AALGAAVVCAETSAPPPIPIPINNAVVNAKPLMVNPFRCVLSGDGALRFAHCRRHEVAQIAANAGLELADALAAHREALAHVGEARRLLAEQAHLEDPALPRVERRAKRRDGAADAGFVLPLLAQDVGTEVGLVGDQISGR